MNGTVLDALGLASIINTLSSLIANCILIKPTVFRAKAIFFVWSLICFTVNSPRLNTGRVAFESPEWIPHG